MGVDVGMLVGGRAVAVGGAGVISMRGVTVQDPDMEVASIVVVGNVESSPTSVGIISRK